MTRRQLLRILAGAFAGAAAALAGATVAGLAGARDVVRRTTTVSSDILRRIHRRTRPLDPSQLERNDDLAG
jgi:hypothetical protein